MNKLELCLRTESGVLAFALEQAIEAAVQSLKAVGERVSNNLRKSTLEEEYMQLLWARLRFNGQDEARKQDVDSGAAEARMALRPTPMAAILPRPSREM